MQRRRFLAASAAASAGAGALLLAGCDRPANVLEGGWVGASHERGHRLRTLASVPGSTSTQLPTAAVTRRASVLIVGAGVAGLAAARALARSGVDDVHLLELEDVPGGNSRGHAMAGQGCPLGAHYLPLPGPAAHEVSEWLHEIGLLRTEFGRTLADERHLCHSPQERLYIDGGWVDGLLPPAEPASRTAEQYEQFGREVARAQRLGFAVPTTRAPWTAEHAVLDAQVFGVWLSHAGFDDTRLRWYLDYCCRDDYGAGIDTVSAWAGMHYFASRHGFHGLADSTDHDPDGVLTWPEGNAWLVAKLAAPFADRLHTGRTVLRVQEQRHGVDVLAWDERTAQAESWTADRVVLALPLHVASRVVDNPPEALRAAAATQTHAPWLVANLLLDRALRDRLGAPPSWDNVRYGSTSLGYVDASHQNLSPMATPGRPRVLTAYQSLPGAQRQALLSEPWETWAQRVIAELTPMHPDLPERLQRIDLMRYGHAMAVPTPGQRGSDALTTLRAMRGRVRFAHADLVGCSVFEEAFTVGTAAGG
jgi:monoamine oxidase